MELLGCHTELMPFFCFGFESLQVNSMAVNVFIGVKDAATWSNFASKDIATFQFHFNFNKTKQNKTNKKKQKEIE